MEKKYILFDLDGTLTDSYLGITRCVQYALNDQGIEENNLDVLKQYIGPSLDYSFNKYHGLTGDNLTRAVAKYRERYKDTGIFENEVYDGIEYCLKTLQSAEKILCLSTCKPEVFAERILEHFGLRQYFTVVTGSDLEGLRKHKSQVIEETFRRIMVDVLDVEPDTDKQNIIKADSIMVGDRDQDVNGAHEEQIECIGVRYGYAKEDELENAGADYIVATVPELTALILS